MIINDTHRFVFIHVPKCAGSTVRHRLKFLDETGGAFATPRGEHPVFGPIDMGHIPLFILRNYFPTQYEKLSIYSTYAIVRNPFVRFPSSVSQHLKMYGPAPIHRLRRTEIKRETDRVIKFLSAQPQHQHCLPREYIHFQRQVDYIFDQREQFIDHLYGTGSIDKLFVDLGRLTREDLRTHQGKSENLINQDVVYRNTAFRVLTETFRPVARNIYRSLPSEDAKAKLRSIVYAPRDSRLQGVFESDNVQNFIKEYYKDDIEMVDATTKI